MLMEAVSWVRMTILNGGGPEQYLAIEVRTRQILCWFVSRRELEIGIGCSRVASRRTISKSVCWRGRLSGDFEDEWVKMDLSSLGRWIAKSQWLPLRLSTFTFAPGIFADY